MINRFLKYFLIASFLVIGIGFLNLKTSSGLTYDTSLLKLADQFRDEKSYQLAIEKYQLLLEDQSITSSIAREIKFKLADCLWRSQNESQIQKAEKILKEFLESKEHDRWWAEANESLAEFYLQRDRWSHTNENKEYLENARDYWAASTEIELARQRFIKVSFTLGDHLSQNWGWHYTGIKPAHLTESLLDVGGLSTFGLEILYEEILKVAQDNNDKAKAHYCLAMSYLNRYGYDKEKQSLIDKHFQEVIQNYPSSEWLDDAYYYLGQFYERLNEFEKALKTYQEFSSHFKKGESQWFDDARNRIKEITSPSFTVSVGNTFLPGSEIQFNLGWRNVKEATITFYKVNLANELKFDLTKKDNDYERGVDQYQDILRNLVETGKFRSLPVSLSFTKKLKEEGKHLWYYENNGLAEWQKKDDEKEIDSSKGILPQGAYLLLVTSGEAKAYDLMLVTDLGLLTKTAGHSALFFSFDSKSGEPSKNTQIKYHYTYYDNNGYWVWEEGSGTTNNSGILQVTLKTSQNPSYANQHQLFACAVDNEAQAFVQGNYYYHSNQGNWWFYAFSDRPAYRPNEQISFKGILRTYDGKNFSTQSGMKIKALIYDPRGNVVKESYYSLNPYGSFADAFSLDEKAPLGEYTLNIYSEDGNQYLINTTLFRLEEYKLPEFLVNLKPKPRDTEDSVLSYRLGDTVQVELDAQYYFGGAVANADVEFLIYQNPYYHTYYPPREYPWYYQDLHTQTSYYGKGQLIKNEKIKTDQEGKAVFQFPTPQNSTTDMIYQIEVRVIDKSRREIQAQTQIKVTRNSFYAYLIPKQNLYRPGDKAEIDLKTITANDEPVSVEGKISVLRNWWQEAVVKEDQISKQPSYGQNELFTKFVKTNDKGEAKFEFEPQEDGFYTVQFTGFDKEGTQVQTQTSVYVCRKQSQDLGYRFGGLTLISEKDTYSVGETARIMLVSHQPQTWVLLTIEAQEIYDYQMINLEGTVKLLEIPVRGDFIPNIFIQGASASNYQMLMAQLPLIIPPEEKFLNVKITSDKEIYLPQEEGHFEIEVKDKDGKPVMGEVALGVVDASVYYIQSEYAKDIREFFFGNKRQLSISTQTSFYQRPYMKLVRGKENRLMSEDEKRREDQMADVNAAVTESGYALGVSGRLRSVGGLVSDEISNLLVPTATSGMLSDYKLNEREGAKRSNKDLTFKQLAKVPKEGLLEEAEQLGQEILETPQIRADFRSTVFWQPTIVTDQNGKAALKMKFPDSLTTWRATARAITPQTNIGNITHEVKTKKELIVRLQAPRFFTERDKVTLSANVHNYTNQEQKIKVSLKLNGLKLLSEESTWITIPASGEKRVDWVCLAEKAGHADITVTAQAKNDSDGMKRIIPIIPHGVEKFIAQAGALKGEQTTDQSHSLKFEIPKDRIKESTSLEIVLSPSLAMAMLDALPYLADYPYGCVEQTMSRFLPSVIVKKTLRDLGLSEAEVMSYISDVLESRRDPRDHPERRLDVTLPKIHKITQEGLKRLYDFQHPDGGWGWWKEDESNRFMSAYVLWGLTLAHQAGIDVRSDVRQRGFNFVQAELVEEENNPDMLSWMVHALSQSKSSSELIDKQRERLWQMRDQLNPYTRALFALAEWNFGNRERAEVLARNLSNGVKEDPENGTAHWGEAGIYYRFSEGGIEATAFTIKALANIDPQNKYLEPAVKWLTLNRRGARWKNTKDTAIAILGLTDYLKTTQELKPNFDFEIFLNGKSIRQGHVDPSNQFTFSRIVSVSADNLSDGKNEVLIKFKGNGALYFSSYLKYFTKEEGITKAGHEVFVERQYFHELKKETLLKGFISEWLALDDGDQIKSGDRIKVEITLDAKNNYEYLVVEDYKPAGFEAVELTSGSVYLESLNSEGKPTQQKIWAYREFRDQRVGFFITNLPEGKHKIIYELRAEVPGEFHGMPNQVHAMYVPEIRANSDEIQFSILDR